MLLSAIFAVATLLALAALAWEPAVGSAAQKVINSPGPLSSIYIDEDFGCQVQAGGDAHPSFYGETEPGGCGTFLALTKGEAVGSAGSHHLFGATTTAPGITPEADFVPAGEPTTSQTLTGIGTPSEPFVVTTHVYAEEPVSGAPSVRVAELTETDSYVIGQDSYETTVTIKNLGSEVLEGTLYHAGDCYLANQDEGDGAVNVTGLGSVACTINANNNPPARLMAFTPTFTGNLTNKFGISPSSYPREPVLHRLGRREAERRTVRR